MVRQVEHPAPACQTGITPKTKVAMDAAGNPFEGRKKVAAF
jgi:hypothetical protein